MIISHMFLAVSTDDRENTHLKYNEVVTAHIFLANKMTTSIYVDSRLAASGNGSDFSITLRESVHIHPGARIRIDKVRFVDSFLTTDLGRYLYYKEAGGGFSYFEVPEQAYTATRLAAAIQNVTGRTTTYTEATNQIQQVVYAGLELLSDLELKQITSGYPSGASNTYPRSLNSILGPSYTDNGFITFMFPKMSPYDDLYLRSSKLSCQNIYGPSGEHDILCKITLDQGVSRVQSDESPWDLYNEITPTSVKTLDFRLTDYTGKVVNLRGRSLSFQITIDQ
jgi:hypothetical protein